MTRLRAAAAGVVALAVAVMMFLLRRRTDQLRVAQVDAVKCHEDWENEKTKNEIASLEAEVETDDKKRVDAKARLDSLLSDDDRARQRLRRQ
jgi:cell division protein FtsB